MSKTTLNKTVDIVMISGKSLLTVKTKCKNELMNFKTLYSRKQKLSVKALTLSTYNFG
jgi:hypothetical protein